MFGRIAFAGATIATLAAASLTPGMASATTAHALPPAGQSTTTSPAAPPLMPCLLQQPSGSPNFVVSQDFDPPYDPYTSLGADDFILTSPCNLASVIANGTYLDGVGTAAQVQLMIYDDGGGQPGSTLMVNETLTTGMFGDSSGTFTMPVSPTVTLPAGTYWISVQAQQVNPLDGWGWATAPQTGSPAVWQNPLDGYGTGCTSWANMQGCYGTANPDFAFELDQRPISKPCYSQMKLGKSVVRSSTTYTRKKKVDELAADDFKIPKRCAVTSVDVPGTILNGNGPIGPVTVTFSQDAVTGGVHHPGTTINAQLVTSFTSPNGTLHLPLPSTVNLPPGLAWISVQAQMAPGSGTWAWRTVPYVTGYKAVWRSLYNSSCVSWSYLTTSACANVPEPDLAFQLNQ